MNKFFTDDFSISQIIACVCVKSGTGQPVHKNRQYHGLVIQLDGVKKYIFDTGVELVVNSGDVLYLPKFSNYEVFNLVNGDCIAVNFELSDTQTTYEPFLQKSPTSYNLKKYFDAILNNWSLKETGYTNICLGNLYTLIFNIQKNNAYLYVSSPTRQLVLDAVTYIHKNISNHTLTIHSISEHLGVSSEYLRRLFKSVYKISPKEYIIDERIKKAKELILSNEFLINQITQLCGYDNESYFSSAFKQICGCSPSEYRSKNFE